MLQCYPKLLLSAIVEGLENRHNYGVIEINVKLGHVSYKGQNQDFEVEKWGC